MLMFLAARGRGQRSPSALEKGRAAAASDEANEAARVDAKPVGGDDDQGVQEHVARRNQATHDRFSSRRSSASRSSSLRRRKRAAPRPGPASASQAARAASRGDRAARSSSAHRPAGGFPAGGLVAARRRESIDPAMIWSESPTSAAPRMAGGLSRPARRNSAWTSRSGTPAACHERASPASAGDRSRPRPRRRESSAAIASMLSRAVTLLTPPYRGGLTENLAGACPSAVAAS